ncbi:CotH kinase family protein [Myxococcus sp. K15C18031901]|uniref:CotH kinase family protein n=1 Tax=Myxococcus dinghuensis TaxID=2906761 RepID=UPI0020A7C713|nr:CotH kinase family protein [Myxococcus dinghuensis]MCP3101548.1 CotH kinase family protein [Myxococcus dinghuensis]
MSHLLSVPSGEARSAHSSRAPLSPRRALLGALLLSLCACQRTAADEPVREEVVEPRVLIEAMDNEQHVLRGILQGTTTFVRVEVFEGGVSLGEARLEAGQWSIPWKPTHESASLEVVAYDAAGTEVRTRLDFQRLTFGAADNLVAAEALLTLPTESDTTTHYTLDGSLPTPTSPEYRAPLALLRRQGQPAPLSLVRTNPAEAPEEWRWSPPEGPVTLATVVRIQRYAGETPVGPSEARTWLIGQKPYTLPVLSLVTDAGNFFDTDRGIYVPGRAYADNPVWEDTWGHGNYRQDGKEWERPVHVEWFDESGAPVLSQNAGVRIHGSGSAAMPQKSLRLYAKEDYGPETFQASFFPALPLSDFKRLIIRTSGQDQLWTKLRDCTLQELLRETTSLALQACRPTVVFLDGEYWGLHEVRERYDEYYLAGHHGLSRKKVVILEGPGLLDTGEEEDVEPYRALVTFVKEHDLADPEAFAYVEARVDVDEFIDYQVAQLFLDNADWPHNNVKFWRYRDGTPGATRAPGDGRWRWLVYDLDTAALNGPEVNSLARVLRDESLPEDSVLLLRSLMKSPAFKARFLARFAWHLETTFAPERVLAAVDQAAAKLAPEMGEHIARWRHPRSMEQWSVDVEGLRDFARRRPDILRRQLEEEVVPY